MALVNVVMVGLAMFSDVGIRPSIVHDVVPENVSDLR